MHTHLIVKYIDKLYFIRFDLYVYVKQIIIASILRFIQMYTMFFELSKYYSKLIYMCVCVCVCARARVYIFRIYFKFILLLYYMLYNTYIIYIIIICKITTNAKLCYYVQNCMCEDVFTFACVNFSPVWQWTVTSCWLFRKRSTAIHTIGNAW